VANVQQKTKQAPSVIDGLVRTVARRDKPVKPKTFV
jgi:hypothetical protein